jgi:hypothetical protein
MPRAFPQTGAAFWRNLLITHDLIAPARLDFTTATWFQKILRTLAALISAL